MIPLTSRWLAKARVLPALTFALCLVNWCGPAALAAETPAAERPTIKELNPVMAKASTEALNKLFSQISLVIKGPATNEIQEIGAPGWAPLKSKESEDQFWPVKLKASVTLSGSAGETNLTLGINFRVYRGTDGNWKAVYAGLFEHPDLDQQSRRLMATFMKTKGSGLPAARNSCINNLRQLDGAKEQWALENKKTVNDSPFWGDLIGFDRYIKLKPQCPDDGTYMLGTMGEKPRCSIEGHDLP